MALELAKFILVLGADPHVADALTVHGRLQSSTRENECQRHGRTRQDAANLPAFVLASNDNSGAPANPGFCTGTEPDKVYVSTLGRSGRRILEAGKGEQVVVPLAVCVCPQVGSPALVLNDSDLSYGV